MFNNPMMLFFLPQLQGSNQFFLFSTPSTLATDSFAALKIRVEYAKPHLLEGKILLSHLALALGLGQWAKEWERLTSHIPGALGKESHHTRCTKTSKEVLQQQKMSPELYTRTGNSAATKPQFTTLNTHKEHKQCLGKGQSGYTVAEELHQASLYFFFGLWNSQLSQAVLQFPGFAPKGKFQGEKKEGYLIGSKALLNWMIQCTSSSITASIATHTLCLVISRASVSDSAPCTQLQGGKVACSLVNSRHYFPSVSVLLSECSL